MISMKLDDRRVKRALKNIEKQIKNPKQLLQNVGNREQEKAEQRIVSSKINPDNRQWRPWAYSTILTRQRDGTLSRGLLYQTGNLLRSFTVKISRATVEIKNSAFYARYLQMGTANMPRREFLGWGVDSMRSLPKAAIKFFRKSWR